MMLFVHCSPTTLEPYRHPNLGVLCSPRSTYGQNITLWPWAADNDAYAAWDETRYVKMLNKIADRHGCTFVTSPDVVGDSVATIDLFWQWRDRVRETGHPVALVGQDGLEDPPWDAFDVLFIGGTTNWKMGDQAASLVREAKMRGMWIHMGRVNSLQRLRYAKAIGCDSVDGSKFNHYRDTYLREGLRDVAEPPQGMLSRTQVLVKTEGEA